MNVAEFIERSHLTTKWFAQKTGFAEVSVRAIVRGFRNLSPKSFARYQWAARGALDPVACGVDPEKVKAHLPDLSKLPHPYYAGVTWQTHCVPEIERLRKQEAAESEGANP